MSIYIRSVQVPKGSKETDMNYKMMFDYIRYNKLYNTLDKKILDLIDPLYLIINCTNKVMYQKKISLYLRKIVNTIKSDKSCICSFAVEFNAEGDQIMFNNFNLSDRTIGSIVLYMNGDVIVI